MWARRAEHLLARPGFGALLCALSLGTGPAHAERAAARSAHAERAAARSAHAERALSGYETESVAEALAQTKETLEPRPEHKRIEGIDVVSLDVFEKRDPVPGIVNVFHATSRPSVIEQEMLVHVGEPYDRALIDETERNLRAERQVSVVVIVATKGADAEHVRLLVVTKDVWSLRLNWDAVFVNGKIKLPKPWEAAELAHLDVTTNRLIVFAGTTIFNGKLQTLVLQPSEENLFGHHKTVNANVVFTPATYTLGLGFVDPRIGGSRLTTSGTANAVFNCRTGNLEGSNGAFLYGKPLYSTKTRWAWTTAFSWAEGISRPAGTIGQSICSDDRAVTRQFRLPSGVVTLPYEYRTDAIRGEISATRSFGTDRKQNVSFGLETTRRVYRPSDLSGQPQAVQEGFAQLLPVSDTRLSPFVELHAYENRFIRVLDLETLGLQEDYALGENVLLRMYPAAKALGSSRDLLGAYSAVGYTLGMGDGLARAVLSSSIEVSTLDKSDASASASVRVVSPRLPFGRVIVDGYALDRYRNYLNSQVALGGTGRLRGYRTLAFVGPDVAVANVEVRSRPVEILSVQLGGAAFYDVGDAGRGFANLSMRQGAGVGLRLAFPQIQRAVFRVDLGFPLTRNDPLAETTVVAQFEQAFTVPQVTSPGLVQ
ncbi:MAG TPA: hypothetical protein VF395_09515 [Polyangiaceae bacterium]